VFLPELKTANLSPERLIGMRKTVAPISLQILFFWIFFTAALLAESPFEPTDESVGGEFGCIEADESVGGEFGCIEADESVGGEFSNPQPATPKPASLRYAARGTGRTTGHIATLRVSNPTPTPLRTMVGDLFIPSDQDYQGYVVLETRPVDVPPFSTVDVPLEGYCTNVQRPPVPDGGTLSDVSQWTPWAEADPLPEPGQTLAPTFFTTSEVPPDDPLALTYPGTSVPFPYRIDFNRHPRAAARLLLHAAWAAGQAFDQLVREGKIRPAALGRSPEILRQDMIQQSLWAYAARLEGKTWDKTTFATQLAEEAEQQLNQPLAAFPAETQQLVDRETQDLWAGISLVGAAAKLIQPASSHPTDIFQETPSGPAVHPASTLSRMLDSTDPAHPNASDRLVPALVFLQKNDTTPVLQALRHSAREKWKTWLNQRAGELSAGSETVVRDVLVLLGYLRAAPGGALPEDERRNLAGMLTEKLNMHIQTRANALQPADTAYLRHRRTLKSWQNTRWYADYCTAANPLKNLPDAQPVRSTPAAFDPARLELSGASWKYVFLPFGSGPKKFPWWIPAVAAGGGGIVYLLLQDKADDAPTPPVAVADAITLPCGGQANLNVLANDIGEGISVTSAAGAPGISASVSGGTGVLFVSAGGTGVFTAAYTVADKAGQTATGSITVTVTDQAAPVIVCPANISLDACDQPTPPTVSGLAAATDDCSPMPTVGFADELSGTPCDRVISRTWSAVDASGKNAVCTQTIRIRDQKAPVFSLCPPAVTVSCGQQNNLDLTGMATAADSCSGTADVTHTDDLSAFANCEGLIRRIFVATDLCGNTATCMQPITVVNPPCAFTPLFAFDPAVCGACNGAIGTTMSPPGSYAFLWENGAAGPDVSGLCPGPISVTITDNLNACTGTFHPEVPDAPMLTLIVVQTFPPSGLSSNDGRVVLQAGPPGAQLPFLIVVNGAPFGTANTYTFQLTNMPAGEYEIFVVDDFGQGCPSNTVFVVLLPQVAPPAGPEIGFVSCWSPADLPALPMPEHPVGISAATPVVWGMPVGFAAGVPLGDLWQFRLEAAHLTGRVYRNGANFSGTARADRLTAGLRRYFPLQASRLVFFQENSVTHTVLRPDIPTLPVQLQWRLSMGGGLGFSLKNRVRMDLSGSLALDFAAQGLRFSPLIQVQAQIDLKNNTQTH